MNPLQEIHCTTADNIILKTSANVIWIIADVARAAKMAAETMHPDGQAIRGEDIHKLRENVLQQALSSLSAFIGKGHKKMYWVRLKGFYVVARVSANFPKIAVNQSVGGCGAAEGNSKPCKPFSPTQYYTGYRLVRGTWDWNKSTL